MYMDWRNWCVQVIPAFKDGVLLTTITATTYTLSLRKKQTERQTNGKAVGKPWKWERKGKETKLGNCKPS